MLPIPREEILARSKSRQERRALNGTQIAEKKTFIKQAPQTESEHLLEWINSRYITTRKKYVEQYNDKDTGDASYSTHGGQPGNDRSCLFDSLLIDHLNQKRTIGVFSGKSGSKFIAFDVDFADNMRKAEEMTLNILGVLRGEFSLDEKEILLTFSGSKGFHIEVFFANKKLVPNWKVERFYSLVLRIVGASTNEVELRPTAGQAVKLPLSINRKTGKRCAIRHQEYLHELPDETLLSVKPVDFAHIEETVNDLESFYPVVKPSPSEENKQGSPNSTFSKDVQMDNITRVMSAGTLIEGGTRHNITYGIAALHNTEGRSGTEAFNTAWNIVETTFHKFRSLLDKPWTLDLLYRETKRVVRLAYDHDIKLGVKAKTVYVSKDDILFVMKARTRKEREMLMLMLIHSRKYANEQGVFYITNDQLTQYGATLNRARLKSYWKGLQEANLLEVLKEDVYSGRKIIVDGQTIAAKDPNQYRLPEMVHENSEDGVELKDFHLDQFDELISQFMTKDEAKTYFSHDQFYKRFKQYYTK